MAKFQVLVKIDAALYIEAENQAAAEQLAEGIVTAGIPGKSITLPGGKNPRTVTFDSAQVVEVAET